jgi:hypothetical protein
MPHLVLHPLVADEAPNNPTLTAYDEEHLLVYVRLLDAEADGADWMEAALLVLRFDPILEPKHSYCLAKSLNASQMDAENGYEHLLRQ